MACTSCSHPPDGRLIQESDKELNEIQEPRRNWQRSSISYGLISYGLLFLLGATINIACHWTALVAPNLLAPPGDPASWQLYTAGAARAVLHGEGGVMRLDVGPVDGVSAHLKCFQRGINLQEGHTYTLRFRARADKLRDMQVEACLDQPDYHDVGLERIAPLLPEWQQFSETFTATRVLANDTDVPRFVVGDKAGTIWFSDVSVVEARP